MSEIIGPAIKIQKENCQSILIIGQIGQTHNDLAEHMNTQTNCSYCLGFLAFIDITIDGFNIMFVEREKAAKIALEAKQIDHPIAELQPEDLIKEAPCQPSKN